MFFHSMEVDEKFAHLRKYVRFSFSKYDSSKRACAVCYVCVSGITLLMSRVSVSYQENYHGLDRDSLCTPNPRSQERLHLEKATSRFSELKAQSEIAPYVASVFQKLLD